MQVSRTVEVRTTRPVYFRAAKGQRLVLALNSGRGYCVTAEAVKVTALSKGGYSVRTLGKGGLNKTRHLSGKSYMIVLTEGNGADALAGTVEDMFNKAQ